MGLRQACHASLNSSQTPPELDSWFQHKFSVPIAGLRCPFRQLAESSACERRFDCKQSDSAWKPSVLAAKRVFSSHASELGRDLSLGKCTPGWH